MRHITNKKFVDFEVEGIATYADMISQIAGRASSGGFNPKDMRTAVAIMDVAEVAGDTISLEDAPWEFLKSKVAAFPFAVAHKELLEFIDAVEQATG